MVSLHKIYGPIDTEIVSRSNTGQYSAWQSVAYTPEKVPCSKQLSEMIFHRPQAWQVFKVLQSYTRGKTSMQKTITHNDSSFLLNIGGIYIYIYIFGCFRAQKVKFNRDPLNTWSSRRFPGPKLISSRGFIEFHRVSHPTRRAGLGHILWNLSEVELLVFLWTWEAGTSDFQQ